MLARELSIKSPDTALQLATQAESLAIALRWCKGIALSNIVKGWCNYVTGNFGPALENNLTAQQLADSIHNEHIAAMAYSNLGQLYDADEDYTQAINYFNEAIVLNLKENDKWSLERKYVCSIWRKWF
ncbi:MAG: tetratricopeptide repeat protein [Bacteroidetes bacterium]|nr:tetratricopeptide repeat protein [Bacteroidota bacterium]